MKLGEDLDLGHDNIDINGVHFLTDYKVAGVWSVVSDTSLALLPIRPMAY